MTVTGALLYAIALCITPTVVFAFSPAPRFASGRVVACRILLRSSNNNNSNNNNFDDVEDDYFDPFLQSPNSFGQYDDDDNSDESISSSSSSSSSSTFGFLAYVENNNVVMNDDPESNIPPPTTPADEFDPLLSPHAYANGANTAPVVDNTDLTTTDLPTTPTTTTTNAASRKIDTTTNDTPTTDIDVDFDPLLSPHAYSNGVDVAPTTTVGSIGTDDDDDHVVKQQQQQQQQKIGILLIDHGSKRQASNDHIHTIAKMYEARLNNQTKKDRHHDGDDTTTTTTTTIVRAAHMELSPPSILDSLRDIITIDKVQKVVCVPYFLSPGRHATEDVPTLISEAKQILMEEEEVGSLLLLLDAENDILVSNALGSQLESMMMAVDELVEGALLNDDS